MAKDNKTKAAPETTPAAEVKTKKVRFLLSPAGQFFLPYNVGQEVDLPENQADEIVDMKYAEFVK